MMSIKVFLFTLVAFTILYPPLNLLFRKNNFKRTKDSTGYIIPRFPKKKEKSIFFLKRFSDGLFGSADYLYKEFFIKYLSK